MKRLLLAPLLIAGFQSPANALPWGDVVIKTVLGEKIIVKKSATNVSKITKEILLSKTKDAISIRRDSFQKCQLSQSKKYCLRLYNPEEREKTLSEWLIELEEKESQKLIAVNIRFQPIFQDLNGRKTSMDVQSARCTNPRLSRLTYAVYPSVIGGDLYGTANSARKKYSTLAMDQVKRKLCDKYAKF